MTTPNETFCRAVVAAVRAPDAPFSAWPDEFPGAWATAARVAEIIGGSVAQVKYRLQELVAAGELTSAKVWPGGPLGYQPHERWFAEPAVFAVPALSGYERQWMLDRLAQWASLHDGQAPRQADWSKANDRDRRWPRWDRVAALFEAEALDKGIRRFVDERCAPDCACSSGRHYSNGEGHSFCDGCFDCLGHCPHGTNGHWFGPSGWQYALQTAGLEVRTGA